MDVEQHMLSLMQIKIKPLITEAKISQKSSKDTLVVMMCQLRQQNNKNESLCQTFVAKNVQILLKIDCSIQHLMQYTRTLKEKQKNNDRKCETKNPRMDS